jgi:hypothetical protein
VKSEFKHRRVTESLELKVLSYLEKTQPKVFVHKETSHEEVMAQSMILSHADVTIAEVMKEGNCGHDLDAYDILSDIGIPLLVNIYCSRGMNYDSSKIEDKLLKLGFKASTCYKLYYLLTKWRQHVEATNKRKLLGTTDIESTTDSQLSFISSLST